MTAQLMLILAALSSNQMPAKHPFILDLTNANNTTVWSGNLTAAQIIDEILADYQFQQDDKIDIKVKTPLIVNSKQTANDMSGLPISPDRMSKGVQNSEIMMPFHSYDNMDKNGEFSLVSMTDHVDEVLTKITGVNGHNTKLQGEANCGGLFPSSQIEITWTNCKNFGSITNTYECKSKEESSFWQAKSTSQSAAFILEDCEI